MSTVKIKTEPPTTPAIAAASVGVQVKLEPSLSATDIKIELESHADTKEWEEDDIKSEDDDDKDDDGDTDQKQQQFICDHHGCDRGFNYIGNRRMHQHEHMLQAEFYIFGKICILTRRSLNDRWPCPIPDCTSTAITAGALRGHVRTYHDITMGQQQQQQQQKEHQPPTQITQRKYYFAYVDDFYVNGIRCGYHKTIGVFICYECRLMPECLLTHLQLKHGFDEKSIDNSTLPESAVDANADPSINQHTNNSHLAAVIRDPSQLQHPDIVKGWLCVTSDCGYCGYTVDNKSSHKKINHQGEQLTVVPAILLRLLYAKTQTMCYLITRLDTTNDNTKPDNSASQYNSEYNDEDDDGDELVLSDMGDDDDDDDIN